MPRLARIQSLYEENTQHALRFGFVHGMYACLEQHFAAQAPENPFETYVHPKLMTMPGMQKEPRYLQHRVEIVEQMRSLAAALPAANREGLFELDCAWDAREYEALWQAFHLGYQAALSLIETVSPPACQRAKATLARFETAFGTSSFSF